MDIHWVLKIYTYNWTNSLINIPITLCCICSMSGMECDWKSFSRGRCQSLIWENVPPNGRVASCVFFSGNCHFRTYSRIVYLTTNNFLFVHLYPRVVLLRNTRSNLNYVVLNSAILSYFFRNMENVMWCSCKSRWV